jgi:hypothetical protein
MQVIVHDHRAVMVEGAGARMSRVRERRVRRWLHLPVPRRLSIAA